MPRQGAKTVGETTLLTVRYAPTRAWESTTNIYVKMSGVDYTAGRSAPKSRNRGRCYSLSLPVLPHHRIRGKLQLPDIRAKDMLAKAARGAPSTTESSASSSTSAASSGRFVRKTTTRSGTRRLVRAIFRQP